FELDLGEDRDGILVLDPVAKVGKPLATYLGMNDTVLEIGITPNRPDAMSHVGVARDVGAFTNTKLKLPALHLRESKRRTADFATIRIEDRIDCPRYTARVILGVKPCQSPPWMQQRLQTVGVRPVNAVVDVTNYVLMECGHPLHAFDYDKLADHTVIVKGASPGESFTTLDHKARLLSPETLMICDAKQSVAIAGVMGGLNSEISDTTVNVLLESAYFRPQSIRRTSKRFGISTEASQRFERGADPNITRWAVDRAANLICEIAGGEILKGSIDVYPKKITERRITLRPNRVREILGIDISPSESVTCLKRLGFAVTTSSSKSVSRISVKCPTNRPDLEREIDLIEEVARIYGYNRIPTETKARIRFSESAPSVELEASLRNILVGRGMNEVVSNSMQQKEIASIASTDIVRIANPISVDMAAMRSSLVPGILPIVRNDIYHGVKDLRLFELGKVYYLKSGAYAEKSHLLIGLTGAAEPIRWDQPPRNVDIYDLKGEIELLCGKILLDKIKFIPYRTTNSLTDNGVILEIQGVEAGFLGRLRTDLMERFEVPQELFIAELDVDVLHRSIGARAKYREQSKYPSVRRDLAVIVDRTLPAESIEKEIVASGSSLLQSVELFDIYEGDQVGQNRKSCAFALEFLSQNRTLVQDEIDRVMYDIIGHLEKTLQASLRI
ncbi:MAG TPA: phenylalanine--tRNA ligase subunit beta, partial [Bacteroidota bacterium]|nr:phenylalanine--tRNA ligase subunit beta [Bacteroidota bacterium]